MWGSNLSFPSHSWVQRVLSTELHSLGRSIHFNSNILLFKFWKKKMWNRTVDMSSLIIRPIHITQSIRSLYIYLISLATREQWCWIASNWKGGITESSIVRRVTSLLILHGTWKSYYVFRIKFNVKVSTELEGPKSHNHNTRETKSVIKPIFKCNLPANF